MEEGLALDKNLGASRKAQYEAVCAGPWVEVIVGSGKQSSDCFSVRNQVESEIN